MKSELKVNIGCGNDIREGFINIDIDKSVNADKHCNIEEGLPFKDNSVDYIYTRHCLEHIHQEKFNFVLEEIRRVCRDKAIVEIHVPYFTNVLTFRTLTHYTPMTYNSFNNLGFNILKRKFSFFRTSFPYRQNKILNILKFVNPILSFFPNILPNVYERLFCWVFPMEEIYFKLEVVK